ncbi:unnamed protein product [Clonostachys rosea]|uniref:Uncharacterized protein n=1 Tax=Bionectria ochroleuca TaxID=29856 RepID=A0ABY6TMZ2_BIOOC|nr:unnamed protein product [Clonostachys rosea]
MAYNQLGPEDDADGFNEIYVACNPPLLPGGVDHIISQATQRFADGEVAEILYDPDAAWFKCIVSTLARDTVSKYIEELLREIIEEETCPLDPDDEIDSEDDHEDGRSHSVDIEIIAETPRVVPWSTYQIELDLNRGGYAPYEYPEVLASTPYKSIWRAPEILRGATIDAVLHSSSCLAAGYAETITLEEFAKLVKCEIYPNLDQNVLYIGSCESEENVSDAIKRLDNIWKIAITLTLEEKTRHIIPIIIENQRDYKLAYRYLSHIGLSKRTYLAPDHTGSTEDEYAALVNGATLRTATFNSDKGDWVVDPRVYPRVRGALEPVPPLEIFEKQSYTAKKPPAKAQPQKSSPTKVVSVPPPTASQPPRGGNVSRAQPKKKINSASIPHPPTIKPSPLKPKQEKRGELSSARNSQDPVGNTSAPVMVNEWVEQQQKTHHQKGSKSLQVGKVDGLFQASAKKLYKGAGATPENNRNVREQAAGSQQQTFDLLGIESSAMQGIGDARNDNLIDSDVPFVSGLNIDYPLLDPEAVAQFGLREDEDLIDFHSTMQQQAGRKRPKHPNQGQQTSITADSPEKQRTDQSTESQPTKENDTALNLKPQTGSVKTSNQQNTPASSEGVPKSSDPGGISSQSKLTQASSFMALLSKKSEALKFRKTHWEILQRDLKEMGKILQLTPGKVELELSLGRIYFKNIGESIVDIGRGPHWSIESLLASFEDGIPQSSIGFQNILTSSPSDAARIVQFGLTDGSKWKLYDSVAKYEFSCHLYEDEGKASFKVVLDVNTLSHLCLGEIEEIAKAYVHCPQFAWDMKARATRVHHNLPEKCKLFAKSLVESVIITPVKSGDVIITVPGDESKGFSVDQVSIRHLARYRCDQVEEGRQLNIAMVRPFTKKTDYTNKKSPSLFCGKTWFATNRLNKGQKAGLDEWYEVSISSSKADDVFRGNMNLGFGENAGWELSELDGILADICQPALDMLSQMDDIGAANDNSVGPELSIRPRVHEMQARFW